MQTAFYQDKFGRPRCALYYVGWNDLRNAHIPNLDPAYADFHLPSQVDSQKVRRIGGAHVTLSPLLTLGLRLVGPEVDTVRYFADPYGKPPVDGGDPADATWRIALIPDAAPKVEITAEPTGDSSGMLSTRWKVSDDYGVTGVTADIYLADDQDEGMGFADVAEVSRAYESRQVDLHAKVAVIDGHWATVGSSNTYRVRPVSRLDSSSASLTRCASPPDKVVADCPRRM